MEDRIAWWALGQLNCAVHIFLFLFFLIFSSSSLDFPVALTPLLAAENARLRVMAAGGGTLEPYIFDADKGLGIGGWVSCEGVKKQCIGLWFFELWVIQKVTHLIWFFTVLGTIFCWHSAESSFKKSCRTAITGELIPLSPLSAPRVSSSVSEFSTAVKIKVNSGHFNINYTEKIGIMFTFFFFLLFGL